MDTSKLKRRLLKLPQIAKSELNTGFAKGAQEIVDMQKRLVARGRVSPGPDDDLVESITWKWGASKGAVKRGGKSINVAQGASGKGPLALRIVAGNGRVRYAHLIEFGTAPHVNKGKFAGTQHPGTAPQPFFYPAYRAKRKAFKSRQRRAFKKAIIASRGA